jgi:hypothetical protein
MLFCLILKRIYVNEIIFLKFGHLSVVFMVALQAWLARLAWFWQSGFHFQQLSHPQFTHSKIPLSSIGKIRHKSCSCLDILLRTRNLRRIVIRLT